MTNSNLIRIVESILGRVAKRRAIVIGDVCLDLHFFVDEEPGEISVETGLPTRNVSRWHSRPGGAANAAANLKALGFGEVQLFGYVGLDMHGRELRALLDERGIDADGLVNVTRDAWTTNVYTKLYRGDCEDPRIDLLSTGETTNEEEGELLKRIADALQGADIVIVNQQLERGVHSPAFRHSLCELLGRRGAPPHLVDSRHFHDEFPEGIHKINDKEIMRLPLVAEASGEPRLTPTLARTLLPRLHRRWKRPLFVTRAARGCYVYDGSEVNTVPALMERGPIDPVGAGDSFLAGVAAGLSAGATPVECAWFGTLVSGVTIHKRFEAGTASAEEIRALASDADFRNNADATTESYRRTFVDSTDIEIVTSPPESGRGRFRHVVFDHDGTVSVLRQGWEPVMAEVMREAITGDQSGATDPDLTRTISERIKRFIDETTGVQTIVQMQGLVSLIREFGLVHEDDVQTAATYKRVYNDRLMEYVRDRVEAFGSGRYELQDVTIKGAVDFLRKLAGRPDLTIYLASGTDVADVREEAETLGYAAYFNGGIFGSVGDPRNDPKKVVLQDILDRAGAGEDVIVFGDGPVEIRETKKRGGYAVGLVTDEVRRYGANPAKRTRLVHAGADLLAPDFSRPDTLLDLLFGDGDRR